MLYMVCVKDRAIDSFLTPFPVTHTGGAVRSFSDEINRVGSDMYPHAADYDLYCCGEFDQSTGCFVELARPSLLIRGQDCRVTATEVSNAPQ